jgi:hypothetical protein
MPLILISIGIIVFVSFIRNKKPDDKTLEVEGEE